MREQEAPDIAALRPWLLVDGPDEAGEWAGYCPLHDDSNASASFNFDKYVWRCFAGCEDGSIGELLHKLEEGGDNAGEITVMGDRGGFTANVVDINSAKRKRRGSVALPSLASVMGWHSALLSSSELLRDLAVRRGLNRSTVEDMTIGWDSTEEAYTIPFQGEDGSLVNVKWYRIDQGQHEKKMWGVSGHNERRLYPGPPDEMDDEVLLCEGEMDTLLARQYGFNAITGSGGVKSWRKEWTPLFLGKSVYVCYDRDSSGAIGEEKVVKGLKGVAKEVRLVELPYERKPDDNHGKDLTDFWHEYGNDLFATELKELMTRAKLAAGKQEVDDGILDIGILDSMNVKLVGQRLRMRSQVVARTGDTRSYPKKMSVECYQDKGDKCSFCPMSMGIGSASDKGLKAAVEVAPDDPMILELLEPGRDVVKNALVREMNTRCKDVVVEVEEYENLQVLGVRKAVDEDEESDQREDLTSVRKVLVTPEFTTMPNRTVSLTGKVVPNERTKVNEYLAWEVEDTETSLDKFRMTPEMNKRLRVFQPSRGQKPLEKCAEIARDLAGNVTGIIGRGDLHVALDLVWHSVLRFRLDDKLLRKGWLEMMVAGDTRTGKSEAAARLAQHYHAGRVVSAETATRAGLLGGSQRVNDEWTVTWGIVPLSDRRLVVIDEVSGLSHDDIGQMSSVRSSGVAEVRQIQSDSVPARTRLVWMGNPRSGLSMRESGDAIDVIQDLLGAPEDIARLDFAMAVRSDDVSMAEINRHDRPKPEHLYTRDLCHDLVMWAWSRQPHQVQWQRGAEREVYQQAVRMAERYTEQPPLIQGANAREKIARMAVALAARTFSTDDGTNVLVTRRHVRDIVRFLDHLYSKPAFGYRDRSKQSKEREQLAKKNIDLVTNDLYGDPSFERFLQDIQGVSFAPDQLGIDLNLDQSEVRAKVSKYREFGMLVAHTLNGRTTYRMAPELIDLLRTLREEDR